MKNHTLIAIGFLISVFISSGVNAQIITTVAGNGIEGFNGDAGPATDAEIYRSDCIALDGSGNLFFVDRAKHCIRKVSADGIISTITDTSSGGFSGDGGPASVAILNNPASVAFDRVGNMYIADSWNNRIRKIDTIGNISTYAGVGSAGFSGDGGAASAAEFNRPIAVAVDAIGNVFVSDAANICVRKVDTTGTITTVAGNHTTGYSGDGGPATACALGGVAGLSVDKNGQLFITDAFNNCIRKVDVFGVITTIAGTGFGGFSGDGGSATSALLNFPHDVAVDSLENIYIADYYNNRIRKVDNLGTITTIAGSSLIAGYFGDDGAATSARLFYPISVCHDNAGNIFISDFGNYRMRKIGMSSVLINPTALSGVRSYTNPVTNILKVESSTPISKIQMHSLNGRKICEHDCGSKQVEVNVGNLVPGIYLLLVDGVEIGSVVKL